MAMCGSIFLILVFIVCISLANSNDINQLYMSIQNSISFKPSSPDYAIGQFTFVKAILCPTMCLHVVGCQLVMYDSIDGNCTIYNSTDGILKSSNGCIIYIPINTITTSTSTTIEATTTTSPIAVETSTTSSVSTCITETFPSFNINLLALWSFDSNLNDDGGLYPGTPKGDAGIQSNGYINGDLSLPGGTLSYVKTPYIDLTATSFTIELWIWIEYFSGSNMTIVSQNNLNLQISGNGIVFISETPPSVGTQLIQNKWYHIALVNENNLMQQQIYVNGILDSTYALSFNFTVGSTFYIGTLDGLSEFVNGEIDHLSITTRVKSACEIFRDASLIAFYTFTPTVDANLGSGPYGITGYVHGTNETRPGVIGDCLVINDTSAYFQVSGLTVLTKTNTDFSFTFFIKPYNEEICSLLFLSGTSDNSDIANAKPYLGIDSSGNLVGEIPTSVIIQTSAHIPVGQWSHVALTYSYLNYRASVYYNGTLQNSVTNAAPMYNPPVTTPPLYVTLANPLGGQNGSAIEARAFIGDLDEFYIWSRELNASEIYSAATVG